MPASGKIGAGIAGLLLVLGLGYGVLAWHAQGSTVAALDVKDPTPEQIAMIAGLLADQSGRYRGQAETRLHELGEKAIPALLELVKNEAGEEVQATAAKLAAEIDPEGQGFGGLEAMLKDPNQDIRSKAARILVQFSRPSMEISKSPHVAELLLIAADDADPKIRLTAINGLELIRTKEVGAKLKAMTKDSDEEVATHAARRLKIRGGK